MKTLINYLSDTITLPTEEMLKAIQNAELGDDVYGQDKTVNELEGYAANMLGMEAACFMPSGTMANLASILAHCPRGLQFWLGMNLTFIFMRQVEHLSVEGLCINQLKRSQMVDCY